MPPIFRRWRSFLVPRWNHRHQHIGFLPRAGVQRVFAAEDRGWPVARIVVQKGSAPFQFILEIRQPRAGGFLPFVIAAAHGERDAATGRHHDRGRPQLDVERHCFTGLERLRFVVRVIRTVRRGKRGIELAVRGAQPALGDRGVRIDRAHEHHFPQVRREHAEYQKQIGVGGGRGNEQLRRKRARDLGVGLERRRKEARAVAQCRIRNASGRFDRFTAEAVVDDIEIELRPLRARNRPLVFMALDKAVYIAIRNLRM